MTTETRCPLSGHSPAASHAFNGDTANKDWWPNQLCVGPLNQHSEKSDPLGSNSNYRKPFNTTDYDALETDLHRLIIDPQDWWPADFSCYGPRFIRMARHAVGICRTGDGRSGIGYGQQHSAPLNSWPDDVNIDKSRRLLWLIKQKYGRATSWAGLLILTSNATLGTMGFRTFGFAVGREDTQEPDNGAYWGNKAEWLEPTQYLGERNLVSPFAAVQTGLICISPEGPEHAHGDPFVAAKDIRKTFARMVIDGEKTVALIAGGHTFGRTYGAGPVNHVGADAETAPPGSQGLGWASTYDTGKGADTITDELEVT